MGRYYSKVTLEVMKQINILMEIIYSCDLQTLEHMRITGRDL